MYHMAYLFPWVSNQARATVGALVAHIAHHSLGTLHSRYSWVSIISLHTVIDWILCLLVVSTVR